MKILFSNPPWWSSEEKAPDGSYMLRQGRRAGSRWPFTEKAAYLPDHFRFGAYYPFPFFMGYAASYVQKAVPEAQVIFRDSITRGESYATFFDYLAWLMPDFIFIESATSAWGHDKKLLARIRTSSPRTKVILTGPIAGHAAEELADAYIKGEYEKGSVKVVNGARGLVENDLLTVEEMNSAPIPMMDDITATHYCDTNPRGQVWPHLQLWASRGCPYRCCFCVWPAVMTGNDPTGSGKRSVRVYSKEHMKAYLDEMIGRYKYRSIYFDDDTFNLVNKHTLEMCEVMREVKLPWSAMCRADTSTREVWKEMKDSGCFGVKVGFESGSQEVIDKIINKRLDLAEGEATVHYLKELGMTVHGTFTVGLPGETDAQRAQTMAFIRKLPLDSYQLSGTAEIEGTPLANMKQGEALKAYPNAIKDASYVANPDGQMKREHMAV
jgi:radical SAM superfamily enzyme YgiQ (UPF0313 family)